MSSHIADKIEPEHDLRVILVGRTGIESSLRRDPGIELVRVNNTLHAIGELANPIDSDSPRLSVVVLGAEPLQSSELDTLTASLRKVDSDVRVVGVGLHGQYRSESVGTSRETGLDAWLTSNSTGTELRSLFDPHYEQLTDSGFGIDTSEAHTGDSPLRLDEPVEREPEPAAPAEPEPGAPPSQPQQPETHGPEIGVRGETLEQFDDRMSRREAEQRGDDPFAGTWEEEQRAGAWREPPETMEGAEPPAEEGTEISFVASSEEPEEDPRSEARATPPPPGEESFSTWTALEASEDLSILRTMLSGGDVLPACMTRLRRRLAPHEISFHACTVEERASRPEVGEGRALADVRYKGRLFGWLEGPASLATDMGVLGEWLAHSLALQEQRSQLRLAAFTDPLTNAWNRRYFDGFLAAAIEQARHRRNSLTLLLFDVDNFKEYNDRFGHKTGDAILKQTVRLMRSVIRPTDRVCRIGGDEFAVVFYEPEGPRNPRSHHPSSIMGVVKRFQQQINAHKFPELGERAKGWLTISGGLATFPWDGLDSASLLKRADELVLESKRLGKNKICIGHGAKRAIRGDEAASDYPDFGGSGG